MGCVFDIAHADWEHRTKVVEDRNFLADQRGPRRMVMTTEDIKYRTATEKYLKRKQDEQRRKQQHEQELPLATTAHADVSSNSSSSEEENSVRDQTYKGNRGGMASKRRARNQQLPKAKRRILDDPSFNAALDRTQTSSRQAMMIVTPALAAAGVDVDELSLSRSSLMRARNDSREMLAATVRQDFQPTVPLVAHFDGKMLLHSDGTKHDSFAVVVSGLNIEKLLGIPVISSGTGQQMGQNVVEFVHEWKGVEDHLAALCFDTTASNTGVHTGAITVVQHSFNRRLLFLACRHHMFEIYASAVFDTFFSSKGPEIELFRRFKVGWNNIDKSKFDPLAHNDADIGSLTDSETKWLESRRSDVIKSLKLHLGEAQPREDYKEFAMLTLQLLGENIDSGFTVPGAYHRARWMAKGIYCLKIFGFRHQFHMNKREINSLRRICLFITTIYASYWFTAPLASSAPANDLRMLQLIEDFKVVDSKVAGVAEGKIRLHLWYLSEDLAALSLFSKDSTYDDKVAIVNAMQRDPFPEDVRRVAPGKISNFKAVSVADFVTQRSFNLFESLRLSKQFLETPVDTWSQRSDYQSACQTVQALKVVNDCAERAVKLATDFNEILTKNDFQRQLLYQVVEYHRKRLPTNATKSQLVNNLK